MKRRILFLCTGNSCRSQMAEGFARHLHGDAVEVASAGTIAKGLDPRAVAVMAEVGVDISGHTSKTLGDLGNREWDLVVTVCDKARESCPVFHGDVEKRHHSFDDPPHLAADETAEENALGHYRRVRDEIRAFVETL